MSFWWRVISKKNTKFGLSIKFQYVTRFNFIERYKYEAKKHRIHNKILPIDYFVGQASQNNIIKKFWRLFVTECFAWKVCVVNVAQYSSYKGYILPICFAVQTCGYRLTLIVTLFFYAAIMDWLKVTSLMTAVHVS